MPNAGRTRRRFRWGHWAALPLAFALLAGARQEDAVLERMAEAYENLRSLEADITQTKTYTLLGIEDPPETGLIQVKPEGDGMNVRLEFNVPQVRVLTVRDRRYTLYQPRIKQAIVGNVGEARDTKAGGFLKYLLGDLEGAKEQFTIEVLGREEVDGRETTHLRLTPKKGSEDLYYRQIDLWVDDELSLPVREELVEPNQDVIRIRLENVKVNVPIPDSRFEQKLPEGVEIVRG